jgi:MFS family permease
VEFVCDLYFKLIIVCPFQGAKAMIFKAQLKAKVATWPYALLSVMAALSAFGAYTCMYSFRKAFTAGTFTGSEYLNVDYKVWLVIAQIIGYTLSKFYGIRFISEVTQGNRGKSILLFIGFAWLALFLFAITPAPWNIIFLFMNGLPLGMIWGLIFGYLEGRRSTEFMGAVMCITLIFASGFVKTIGRTLISSFHVNEYYMPFLTGAIFVIPLILFVFCLELLPEPDAEDKRLRTERLPMSAADRKQFLIRFLPGIVLTVISYIMLTVMRDIRDNFEVEIWAGMGIKTPSIYASIDTLIAIIILVMLSLLILIKKNILAFSIIHLMIILGCLLVGTSTILYNAHLIRPITWMTMAGLGLYMGYVPYNAVFFERMIAVFKYRSNIGFAVYVADAIAYLGSVCVLMTKELGGGSISWLDFFNWGTIVVAIIGGVSTILSLIYFLQSAYATKNKLSSNVATDNSVPMNVYADIK